jgi:hypothetical protein
MENSAKSLFCSVFVNKFHHRTKFMVLLQSTFAFKRQLRIQNSKILSPRGTSHTNSDSEWENENFVSLKVSYKFRILNAILNFLVCNMMKVFKRPTSASDFFS